MCDFDLHDHDYNYNVDELLPLHDGRAPPHSSYPFHRKSSRFILHPLIPITHACHTSQRGNALHFHSLSVSSALFRTVGTHHIHANRTRVPPNSATNLSCDNLGATCMSCRWVAQRPATVGRPWPGHRSIASPARLLRRSDM